MGRAPCCDKARVKRGPWSPEEDRKLREYIHKHGTGGNWIALPHKAGLKRCGKSCRLRWLNYLRPNIKHDDFSDDEDRIICGLFAAIGSRWSVIAAQLPGRTDNDVKNYWNTKLKKKLVMHAHHNHGLSLITTTMMEPPPDHTASNSYHHHHHRSNSNKKHLFFSAEEAPPSSTTPLFPPGDPTLSSLPYLSTLISQYSNQQSHHCYYNTTTSSAPTSLLSAAGSSGGLLMFGGNNNNGDEQQMMMTSTSCSGSAGLGLYFELCNNNGGRDDRVDVAAGLSVESSFILQDDERHKEPLPTQRYHQYGADSNGGSDGFFYGGYREETSSSSPAAAGVSQQGSFMY